VPDLNNDIRQRAPKRLIAEYVVEQSHQFVPVAAAPVPVNSFAAKDDIHNIQRPTPVRVAAQPIDLVPPKSGMTRALRFVTTALTRQVSLRTWPPVVGWMGANSWECDQ
jgi:hypothetical protein